MDEDGGIRRGAYAVFLVLVVVSAVFARAVERASGCGREMLDSGVLRCRALVWGESGVRRCLEAVIIWPVELRGAADELVLKSGRLA